MNSRKWLYILTGCFIVTFCHAFELDWVDENWIASDSASQNQTLTDVDGSDIDVTISILISGASKMGTSTTISSSTGSVRLGADYHNRNRLTNYIDVTISFSSVVTGVSFSLDDVDKGGSNSNAYWEDVIENISGNGITGSVTADANWGSNIVPDTTTDPGETMYRGTDYASWDDSSRLTLSWSAPVSEVTFRYSGGNNTRSSPNFQVVGLSNITFYEYQAVPEPGTYLLGALGSLTLAISFIRKRKKEKHESNT